MTEHHHDEFIDTASGLKTVQSYVTGLAMSIVLTLLAFGTISMHWFTGAEAYIVLSMLAVTQLYVQCVCFLRLNFSSEGRWNLLPFLFVILIMMILVGGSLWIMYNLNCNMIN